MPKFENKDKNGPPDVSLVTSDGQRISCHKAILMQESDYFKAMFGPNFLEKNQQLVTLQDVDGGALKKLLDLAYDHSQDLDENGARNLIETASMLQFTVIQEKCAKILQDGIKAENVIDLLILSDFLEIDSLRKRAQSFILYHFNLVAKTKCFKKIPEKMLISIISHPHLHCIDETQLAEAIDSWIVHNVNKESTSSYNAMFELFYHVRFGELSVNQLSTISLLQTIRCSETLSELVHLLICKKNGKELKPCNCPCHGHQEKLLTYPELLCPYCFLHCSSKDLSFRNAAEKICCISSTCFRTKIINKPASCEEETFKRESEEEGKTELCRQPRTIHLIDQLSKGKRTLPSVPCVVGHVYSSNGKQSDMRKRLKPDCSPVLLVYNIDTNDFNPLVWLEKIYEGPVEASGYKVCAVGKDIYIIGGEYLLGYSNWQRSVWKYDTVGCKWSVETSLDSPRRHFSLCVVNQFIYIMGGFGKHRIVLNSVECYDTARGYWKSCASLKIPLYSSACCYYKGDIFLFSNQIFAYDLQSDKWRSVTVSNVNSFDRDIVFSEAIPVGDQGIYLTSVRSSCLYLLDFSCPSEPRLELMGKFQHVVLNSCYVESKRCIVTFSTVCLDFGIPEDSNVLQVVESFDVVKKSFSILWQSPSSNHVKDFGLRHNLGCFSLLHYF